MTHHIPQILMIVLMSLELGIVAAKNGEPKTGSLAQYSFGSTFLGNALIVALLLWGGFFS